MSNTRYLVQYGNYVLSNNRFGVNTGDHYSSVVKDVQYQSGARSNGVTVLNTRNKEKQINLSGVLNKNNGDLNQNIEDLDYLFGIDNQLFRLVPEWVEVFTPTVITDFTAGSDATNLGTDSRDIQVSAASITFDVDVSASVNDYAELTYAAPAQVDLSSYTDTGNFEFALKIPNAENITSIEFRIGNDSSNYYGYTFSGDYQGSGIRYGWNWFSIPWGEGDLPTGQTYANKVTETGTVNDAQLDYMYIKINYSSSNVDISGCAFGGLVWVNESRARNFPCYLDSAVRKGQSGGAQNTLMPWNTTLLNYTGYSRATHEVKAVDTPSIGSSTADTVDYQGSLNPLPKFTLTVADISTINSLNITNKKNSQLLSLQVSNVTSGDVFELGGLNRSYTINSTPLDFEGRLPEYDPGVNTTQILFAGGSPATLTNSITTKQTTDNLANLWGKMAISFIPTVSGALTSAYITALGPNAVTHTSNISIYTDTAGQPNAAINETNSFVLYNSGNPNTTWGNVFTAADVLITSGTQYWLVVNHIAGPTGSATYRYNMNGERTAPNFYYEFLTGGGWQLGTVTATFAYSVNLAASVTADVEYIQSYYPLYK